MIHRLHTEKTPTGTSYRDTSQGTEISETCTQIHEVYREAPSAPPRAQRDLKLKPEPATQRQALNRSQATQQTDSEGGWHQWPPHPENIVVYWLTTPKTKELDSPWKPAKSFPSQVFTSLSSDSWENDKFGKGAKLCWHIMRESICPVSVTIQSNGLSGLMLHLGGGGQVLILKVTSFHCNHEVGRPVARGIQDEMKQHRNILHLFASLQVVKWFFTEELVLGLWGWLYFAMKAAILSNTWSFSQQMRHFLVILQVHPLVYLYLLLSIKWQCSFGSFSNTVEYSDGGMRVSRKWRHPNVQLW